MSPDVWTRELALPGDQRFFRRARDGKIAVADHSGPLPHQTDDGVLLVDFDRPLRIEVGSRSTWLSIPVIKERDGGRYVCGVGIENATHVVRYLSACRGRAVDVEGGEAGWVCATLVGALQGVAIQVHMPGTA